MENAQLKVKTEIEGSVKEFDRNMVKIEALIKKNGLNDEIQQLVNENVSSLSQKCATFENEILKSSLKEQLNQYVESFRKKTYKWFLKSRCIKRSIDKPQGYAGDFEIIDWIYQNKPEGKGLGFALDRYFLENRGSQAMRSRKQFIVEKISSMMKARTQARLKDFSLFDLGCGPGRDILEIFEITGPARAILMDQDKDALNYSKKVLKPYLGHIEFVQYNLLRIIAGEKYVAKKFGLHDVVMCIGLYDYLDENASVRLLKSSYNLLKENGVLVISNWDVSNPSKTELEWVCDWHLYHRTKQDVASMIKEAGIPLKGVVLETDLTGHFHIGFINK
jgi:extracellular factor (EF) 3-hydroxypalmitic acid methyl ester biosynthesis protein